MITERTLKRWRKESLSANIVINSRPLPLDKSGSVMLEKNNRILRMTQELLDLHLLRKK